MAKSTQNIVANYNYEVNKISDSDVELTVTVNPEKVKEIQDKVYQELAKSTEIAGFRPGKAPKDVIMQKISSQVILNTYDRLVPEITAEIVAKENYKVLGKISYDFKDNEKASLVFTAKFPVLPALKLPDFSNLKIEREKVEVSDAEIEKVYNEVKEKSLENKDKDTKPEVWIKELNIPNVTDKKQLEDFIKSSLETSKKQTVEDNYLTNMIAEASKHANLIPSLIATENEIAIKEKNYRQRIEKLGISVEDFLKTQNTTLEKLKEKWKLDAETALAADMLFLTIANEYNLKVENSEVATEIANIPDPKVRVSYQTPKGQESIFISLFRQKALQKLKDLVEKK